MINKKLGDVDTTSFKDNLSLLKKFLINNF